MKLRCLLPALVWLCALTASAQTFTDDLATKRANLVYQMRALGPLAPADWVTSRALWVFNYEPDFGQYTWHGVGNYGYVNLGADPTGYYAYLYDYRYRAAGLWWYSDPTTANPSTQMGLDFLISLPAVPANQTVNYSFGLSANSYNVAGLRLESVFVAHGTDGAGSAYGWIVPRGQTIYTAMSFSTSRTFDLVQNVETPAFKAADYWFGWWPNFPADPKVNSPQDTRRQSAGAFLVASIHTLSPPLIGWAQEGVYRPGFTLQPGYSAPRVQTYMQQYFGDAWKCDATTGTVPRTSTPNWNSVGRINTDTATPAGTVNPNGYFTPSEFGKAILTTRPLEDGSYGELPLYTLGMLVDKNRDGTLDTNDVTTSASPHVFWVNNDYDRAIYEEKNLWDELDLPAATAGATDASFIKNNSRIPSLRDLEDFDRLHIRGLKELCRDLPSGYSVGLRWKTVLSGNPGIYVFRAVESDGGRLYLTTNIVAAAQIAPSTFPPPTGDPGFSPFAVASVEPGATQLLSVAGTTNDFFLYCGTSRGAGELAITVNLGAQVIGEASVFLDLRDVKELYERWTVGEAGFLGTMPATNATLFGGGLPGGVPATAFLSDNPNQPYILYVHGWNMTPDDKDFFAETAFKRLYWQGYTNRFGAFRWPSAFNFGDDLFSYPGPVFVPDHYNRSENYAWRAGEGARQLLVSLNQRYPGKVHLLAHSMGNIVAGEALALNAQKYGGGQIVNTYVASQAAVSLHAYNGANNDPSFQLPFQYVHPKLDYAFAPSNWESGTPNVHRDWLATNRVSCVARVNFYNLHDFALQMDAWGFNQIFKPSGNQGGSYRYIGASTKAWPWVGWFGGARPSPVTAFLIPSPARLGLNPPAFRNLPGYFLFENTGIEYRRLDWEYRLNDMYEAMAFASESRIAPLGAVLDTTVLEGRVNLQAVWSTDTEPDPNNGVHGRHKWHSGQFRMNNMRQQDYWRALLDDRGFNILQ